MADTQKPLLSEQLEILRDKVQDSQVWKSIFRPGSYLRKGYKSTTRDRALATMNNLLYHLHPTKVKRHGLKLTYTFCLGGLSFFLFVLLTITNGNASTCKTYHRMSVGGPTSPPPTKTNFTCLPNTGV